MKTIAHLTLLILAVSSAALSAAVPDLQLTLPERWYAVPGQPMSLWFDNIILTEKPEDYRFAITCDIGSSEAKRWTVTPTDKDTGEHPMSITVSDAQGKPLAQGRTILQVASREAGAAKPLRLLIVGDSLTHATAYPNEIARLLALPGNPTWRMIGTHKPASAAPGVAHEGYGGWTWERFLTLYNAASAGVAAGPLAKKGSSPFLFGDASGQGQLDLPRYFRETSEGQAPDVVTFLLGINDCFGAKPDDLAAMDKHIDGVLAKAESLLAAFHAAAPKAKLAVGLTTPPNARESGFEANYKGKYHRWGWKRIQHRLVQRMMQQLGHREADGIHLVPTELNLDPVDGYPVNNGVHPNPIGYAQIGKSFYAWLKAAGL